MYSAYLFDLDGTIYVGDTLLPGTDRDAFPESTA